jgi:hypothetical protein
MFNKRQRIGTWISLALASFLLGAGIEILAELYFLNSWFQKIASFTFASTSVVGILGIILAFMSLAWNDWQEGKSASNFVSLGENDRVIAVHKTGNATVHLPVVGTTQQTILASNSSELPYVSSGPLEHLHVTSQLPPIELMDDELYERLFGLENGSKEKNR